MAARWMRAAHAAKATATRYTQRKGATHVSLDATAASNACPFDVNARFTPTRDQEAKKAPVRRCASHDAGTAGFVQP